jgi:hypothetical protein
MSQFTTSFPLYLEKAIKETFDNFSKHAIETAKYNQIFKVYDTDEYVESFISQEGIDDFVKLNEATAIKEGTLKEGWKTSLESEEYGLGLNVTYKMMIRAKDNTVNLAKIIEPRNTQLMIAANSKIEVVAHALLNNAFGSDDETVLAPDGVALISGSHQWKSNDSTFSNDLGTANLSTTSWDAVQTRGAQFVDANGRPMPLNYNKIIVKAGSENARAARRIFGMEKRLFADSIGGLNIYEGSGVTVVETPYMTSNTRWFAMASDQHNPLVVKFVEKPKLHPAIVDKALNRFYPATISFEAGVINLPFGILGSKGS